MSKLYSPGTRGFYSKEDHGEQIPDDAVEISDQEWESLIEAQTRGQTIVPGSDGQPVAIGPTREQRGASRRAARDQLLSQTDGLVNRHRDEIEAGGKTTLSADTYKALQQWRAALRTITEDVQFPDVQFPRRPDGI